MKKRSQSALEFLITYGWAILVVIGMITALAYLGVLDMSRFLPSMCSSTISVIPCIGNPVAFRTGELYFLMSNELGHNLILDNETIQTPPECHDVYFCNKNGSTCQLSITIPHHSEYLVWSNCTMLGTRYTGTFIISHTNAISSLTETFRVRVSTRVRQ